MLQVPVMRGNVFPDLQVREGNRLPSPRMRYPVEDVFDIYNLFPDLPRWNAQKLEALEKDPVKAKKFFDELGARLIEEMEEINKKKLEEFYARFTPLSATPQEQGLDWESAAYIIASVVVAVIGVSIGVICLYHSGLLGIT